MREPRGSSSPPRSPATLNDWQGVPPTRTSISWSGHSLNLVMSPWFGTLGYRVASTALGNGSIRSEEHTSELQSLMRISYAVFCLKKKKKNRTKNNQLYHAG